MPITIGLPASLLTLPCELRNQIYFYIFPNAYELDDDDDAQLQEASHTPSTLTLALRLHPPSKYTDPAPTLNPTNHHLNLLLTTRQIHAEAHLLALSHTPFHLPSTYTTPSHFIHQTRHLSPTQLSAVRYLTLTAKISVLRALNETWNNLPFGHPSLRLERLTLVPRRPDCTTSCYAEVAELSQAHTFAYVLAETLKGLRNVRVVEVRNEGCFGQGVWRVLYRSLVLRLWRWGGVRCGVLFEERGSEEGKGWEDGVGGARFRVFFGAARGVGVGREVGEEIIRLAGGEMPALSTAGAGF
ncbi:hypothetical protein LTR62_006836 [Meristemomyces frigidus]|uniref:Uncharacterized protein n=1 Tax=Meristemomyces frigidus TaxID=1508187 RepID=A0AAN7TC59_9PEZI|nr:hypothetical protein LTR62_006836 [Meristemomyces frigidus]